MKALLSKSHLVVSTVNQFKVADYLKGIFNVGVVYIEAIDKNTLKLHDLKGEVAYFTYNTSDGSIVLSEDYQY